MIVLRMCVLMAWSSRQINTNHPCRKAPPRNNTLGERERAKREQGRGRQLAVIKYSGSEKNVNDWRENEESIVA